MAFGTAPVITVPVDFASLLPTRHFNSQAVSVQASCVATGRLSPAPDFGVRRCVSAFASLHLGASVTHHRRPGRRLIAAQGPHYASRLRGRPSGLPARITPKGAPAGARPFVRPRPSHSA